MNYSLYSQKGKKKAEQEADEIINDFLIKMDSWQSKYIDLGASDTASREAFAVNVAKCLGLNIFGDE